MLNICEGWNCSVLGRPKIGRQSFYLASDNIQTYSSMESVQSRSELYTIYGNSNTGLRLLIDDMLS